MANAQLGTVLRQIRKLADRTAARDSTDLELLSRFTADRDQAAFAELVKRHGPLVLRVCRRVLRHEQDAEDVFQAVFLVLARKAGSIRKGEVVASWLYGVAYRIAMKERTSAARRRQREKHAGNPKPVSPDYEAAWRDLQQVLDEELNRLPDKYRAPLVLCCLEGKSKPEAARQLGWKEGTVSSRLAHARKLLQQRLTRRGVTLSAILLGTGLADRTAVAVPPLLALNSVKAAALYAASPALIAGSVSAKAVQLAELALRGMAFWSLRMGTGLLLTMCLLATGLGLARQATAEKQPVTREAGSQESTLPNTERAARVKAERARTDRYGDPLPAGALARLGTTRFRQGLFVYSAAFSPDGKTVATCGAGGGVCLWDVASGKELHRFLPQKHVYSVVFSPDGKILAGANVLWDLKSGKELRRITGNQGGSTMVLAFSPDGKTLASGGHDQLVRVWEVSTGKEIRQLQGHQGSVHALAFSPDGKILASGSGDRCIRLWDPANGQQRGLLTGHEGTVGSLALAPDGKLLASGSEDGTIRIWDLHAGKQVRVLGARFHAPGAIKFSASPVAFAPDGQMLAAGNPDGSICLWNPTSGLEIRRWPAHTHYVRTIAFSPDGKTLVSGGGWDCALHLWEVATGKEIRPFAGHRGLIELLAYAADGKSLYSASRDKVVLRWDLATGRESQCFAWPNYGIVRVALSPDQKTMVTSAWTDGTIRLWDAATRKELRLFGKFPQTAGHVAWCPVAFSPDGKQVAAACNDWTIRLWTTTLAAPAIEFKGRTDQIITSLAFSPDGKLLVTGSRIREKPSIQLWDAAAGKELRAFENLEEVEAVLFSPDGKVLASAGGYSGKPRLWEVATGRELRPLEGPVDGGYGLAFSPDGRFLAAPGPEEDNLLHIWEVSTGLQVRRFSGHSRGVGCVAFAPDGRSLASGGLDSTILIWDLTGRIKNSRLEPVALTRQDVQARWNDLAAGDGPRAFQAVWDLTLCPQQALPFVREKLRPATSGDPQRIARLIRELDSERFAVRKQATEELQEIVDTAEQALRKELARKPSLEVRQRIEHILAKLEPAASPERLRMLRAIQVLEYAGTPAAKQFLETLAQGAAEARQTREARASLERLAKRTTEGPLDRPAGVPALRPEGGGDPDCGGGSAP